jgi:putative tricarboxylic transport membrane protein
MNKTFDRYTSIILSGLGLFVIMESQSISTSSYGSSVGANVFPIGLGAALLVFSIINLYETFTRKYTNKKEEKLEYKKFLVILAALILYALLLEPLGYVISTFLFLIVGFQTMEKGKYLATLLIAAAISAGVYYIYVELMSGTLPGLPAWLSA